MLVVGILWIQKYQLKVLAKRCKEMWFTGYDLVLTWRWSTAAVTDTHKLHALTLTTPKKTSCRFNKYTELSSPHTASNRIKLLFYIIERANKNLVRSSWTTSTWICNSQLLFSQLLGIWHNRNIRIKTTIWKYELYFLLKLIQPIMCPQFVPEHSKACPHSKVIQSLFLTHKMAAFKVFHALRMGIGLTISYATLFSLIQRQMRISLDANMNEGQIRVEREHYTKTT